ncbi:MAG: peptidylprolyl isomerase [Smithella sp.]
MNKFLMKSAVAVLMLLLVATMSGCGKKDEAAKESPAPVVQNQQVESPVVLNKPADEPAMTDSKEAAPRDVAVSVDGVVLKKEDLARKVKAQMNLYKDKISADKKKEVQSGLKKQIMEDFVMRTVLANEVNRRKITVADKDIQAAINQIKANIPSDKNINDFLKENNVSREDIALGIKIKKLVEMENGGKNKPTEKEINKFYADNQDKFTTEESVHVRHILVTIDAKDDEKVKAEKKAKIENLRQQVLKGADFAEIAKNNSDCPSKENGGDLGEIKRGQTVKPFEDAAFSQEINAIGPIVSTEFGHHVIQVLGHDPAKTVSLDEVKDKIGLYLAQQKEAEAFNKMTARLRKNAVILYYEN